MGISIGTAVALTKVKFFDDFASFPTVGSETKLFVARDTGGLYRWTGAAYSIVALNNLSFTIIGEYNATTGLPALSGLVNSGDTFIVTVAGTQTINGTPTDLNVGDLIVKTSSTTLVVVPLQIALFTNVDTNRIPLIVDGVAQNSSISETADLIMFDKSGRFPAGSIDVGSAVRLSENGSFLQMRSALTGNEYIIPLQQITQNTDINVQDNTPFFYAIDAEQTAQELQPIDTTESTFTTFSFPVTQDFQLNAFSLNFVNALTNFRYRAISPATGETIRYFPSEVDFNNGVGINVSAGVQEVFRRNTQFAGRDQVPFRFITEVDQNIEYVADQPVVLRGNGTLPYILADIQNLNKKDFVTEDDFTATEVRDLLQTLTGDDRLDGSAIKNILDANAVHGNVADEINQVSTKTTPNDNDVVLIEDSEDSFNKKKVLVSALTGGSTPITPVPSVHNFSIGIPPRVDINPVTDVVNTTQSVTFSISNHSRITSTVLHIGGNTFTMTNPTNDGVQTQSVVVSGIDLTSATTYNMFIELNTDNTLRSNTQTLEVANAQPHELLYWDIQPSPVASTFNYQSATAENQEITTNENTFNVQTFVGSMHLAIAQPNSETDFSTIFVDNFPQTGAFTKTNNAVVINSVNYDVWVSNNALNGAIVSGDTVRVVR